MATQRAEKSNHFGFLIHTEQDVIFKVRVSIEKN